MRVIILDSTKSLRAVLQSATTTTAPDFTVHYADTTATTFTEDSTDGVLNGTTEVTLVGSPASGTKRVIRSITINNRDSVAVELTVRFVSSGGTRRIWRGTLQVNDTWTSEGVYDTDGKLKVTSSGAGSGEANTASNVGTAGVGVFKQKTGVNLEFKSIAPASNKVTITDDTGDNEVDIDVVEANFTGIPQSAVTNLTTDLSNKQDDLDGLAITNVTPQTTDKVLIQDVSDADNLKYVTAQSIADLAPADNLGNHLATQPLDMDTNPIIMQNQTTPSNPPANNIALWVDNDAGRPIFKIQGETGVIYDVVGDSVTVVRNNSGSPMTKGQLVYITGGNANRPNVSLARADSESTLPVFGIMMEDTLNNDQGLCLNAGLLKDLDTSSFSTGDVLWCSESVAGDFTATKPAIPNNYPQRIGIVTNSHVTQGIIYFFPVTIRGNFEGTNVANWDIGLGSGGGARTVRFNNGSTLTLTATPTTTRTVTIPDNTGTLALTSDLASYQPLDASLTEISGLTISNDDILQQKAGVLTNRTPAQFKVDLVLVKGDVGLGNVDNVQQYSASNRQTNIVDSEIDATGITTRSKLPTAIVYTDQTNTYGAFNQVFPSSRLIIQNPAGTFNYTIVASAIGAGRNLTLPLLTGDDIMVTADFIQTLTNKTINATNNTITDTSIATGDLLKSNGSKFVRFPIGTPLQVLRVNAGGTDLEFATAGGGSQTPWTSDIDADGFDLVDISNIEFRDTTGAPSGSTPSNFLISTTMIHNVPTGGAFNFTVNGLGEYSLNATEMDYLGNNIRNFGFIESNATQVASAGAIRLGNTGADDIVWRNTANSGNCLIHFDTSDDLSFQNFTGGIDFGSSNLTGVGTLNTHPLPTGSGTLASITLAQNWTAGQTFFDDVLKVRNPANTFSYSFRSSAIGANRDITIPLLTGADVMVTADFIQSLTNKTINASSNTITDTSTSLGDLLVSNGTKFVRKARGTANQRLRTNDGATDIEYFTEKATISFIIDGGGSAITTGKKGQLIAEFDCRIIGWTAIADVSGSIVVDVNKSTYAGFPSTSSIAGSELPTLSSVQKNQDLTLSTWTQDVTEGDVLEFEVDSATTVTRVLISLKVEKKG